MFQMHRIFCATPWEMEAERRRFYDAVGQFNETVTMQKGVLYVPVTLTNTMDKRPLQYAVDQNIREARHYVLVLGDDWGPDARNFKRDYALALQSRDDAALPMQSVAVLAKRPPSDRFSADGLPEPFATFDTLAEFEQCVTALLSSWWESLQARQKTAAAG
ncbi:MAG TPA: hypothetical protein VG297_00995 [Bryobacteraceae bacterium]|jgi:hypothetical protein|nr:hypothetical protein [Bryobacteraceae bacterium]